jgi:methylated-DNA-[protein]-cysteine S-methyltransferase
MAFWASFQPDRANIHLAVTDRGICRISLGLEDREFAETLQLQQPLYTWVRDPEAFLIRKTMDQLSAYFRRELTEFDVPLDLRGTEFQLRVWEALRQIPYGRVRTYLDIAKEIGAPKATRAVGAANHVNPVPIIVPCHRVVASNGKLGGFACGLDYKRWLLDVEQMAATILDMREHVDGGLDGSGEYTVS